TKSTITEREDLLKELSAIRKRGYAYDLGEYSPNIRCVAVPVFGFGNSHIAAISCSMSKGTDSKERNELLTQSLVKNAHELSIYLGATDTFLWRREKEN